MSSVIAPSFSINRWKSSNGACVVQVQLRHSLPIEPSSEEEGRIVVALRLTNGRRPKRAWRKTDKISDVYDWVNGSPFDFFIISTVVRDVGNEDKDANQE